MGAIRHLAVVPVCFLAVACGGAKETAQQVTQAGSNWRTNDATDKLSGETIASAVTQAADDAKTGQGELAIECHLPSKNLVIRLSSFAANAGPDGKLPAAPFLGDPQVRFGKSGPGPLDDAFVRKESPYNNVIELDIARTRMAALVATFHDDPIAKTLGEHRGGGDDDIRRINADISSNEQKLADAIADSAKGPGRCTLFISPEDCLKYPAQYRERLAALKAELSEPSAQSSAQQKAIDEVKARPDYAQRVAFWSQVARELRLFNPMADTTLDGLTNASIVSGSLTGSAAARLYGDLFGATSPVAFLEKLGPEIVIAYTAAGGRNTMVLPLGDKSVAGVLNRCR